MGGNYSKSNDQNEDQKPLLNDNPAQKDSFKTKCENIYSEYKQKQTTKDEEKSNIPYKRF